MPVDREKKLEFLINTAYIGAITAFIWLGVQAIKLILPFVFALVLSALLNPVVRLLRRRIKTSRKSIAVFLTAFLYLLLGTVLFFLLAEIAYSIKGVFLALPDWYTDTLAPALTALTDWLDSWISTLSSSWAGALNQARAGIMGSARDFMVNLSGKGIAMVTGIVSGLPGAMIFFLFTVLLSLFVGMQYEQTLRFIKALLPEKAALIFRNLPDILKTTVFRYLKAQALLMLYTFLELSLGFFILRVGNPLGKAVMIAAFDALPIVGTGWILLIWAAIMLVQGNFALAGGLTALYGIVTVVRNVIAPKVVSDQLGLNPVAALMVMYVGYKLSGVGGMIFYPLFAQIALALYKAYGKTPPWQEKARDA